MRMKIAGGGRGAVWAVRLSGEVKIVGFFVLLLASQIVYSNAPLDCVMPLKDGESHRKRCCPAVIYPNTFIHTITRYHVSSTSP